MLLNSTIVVRPAPARRVAFARWAVAQTPKVRTVSTLEFAVPAGLFVDVPEAVLRGSTVDGHPYVSPLDHEDEEEGAGLGGPELLGVATADGFLEAVPGQPLPEVPAAAYGPDSVPLPLPDTALPGEFTAVLMGETGPEAVVALTGAAGDETKDTALASTDTSEGPGDTGDDQGRRYSCSRCARKFPTKRGRDTHRRMVHGR